MTCGRSCSSCDECRSAVAGLFDVSAVDAAVADGARTYAAAAATNDALLFGARVASELAAGPFFHPELRAAARDDGARPRATMGELLDWVTGATFGAGRAVERGAVVVKDKAAAAAGAVGDVVTWPVRQVADAAAKVRTFLVVGAVVVAGLLLLRSSR